uniref:Uncharacterized protein n=1 Tax=Bombyx mori TaxID=7091 RepID=A0A8R1WJ24_BOMMO|nr:uncharacterized protein LOC101739120 [Bombyx mori]
MKYLLVVLLFLYDSCYGRVALQETDIVSQRRTDVKDLSSSLTCTLRTLDAGDPYPSVLVNLNNDLKKITWNSNGEVIQNYFIPPVVSHSYPTFKGLSGSGLSGGGTSSPDYRSLATYVDGGYTIEEVVDWFRNTCQKPY